MIAPLRIKPQELKFSIIFRSKFQLGKIM